MSKHVEAGRRSAPKHMSKHIETCQHASVRSVWTCSDTFRHVSTVLAFFHPTLTRVCDRSHFGSRHFGSSHFCPSNFEPRLDLYLVVQGHLLDPLFSWAEAPQGCRSGAERGCPRFASSVEKICNESQLWEGVGSSQEGSSQAARGGGAATSFQSSTAEEGDDDHSWRWAGGSFWSEGKGESAREGIGQFGRGE